MSGPRDLTCTHGGFTIVCTVGAFLCDGCGVRLVPESILLDVAGAEHRSKQELRAALKRAEEAEKEAARLKAASTEETEFWNGQIANWKMMMGCIRDDNARVRVERDSLRALVKSLAEDVSGALVLGKDGLQHSPECMGQHGYPCKPWCADIRERLASLPEDLKP